MILSGISCERICKTEETILNLDTSLWVREVFLFEILVVMPTEMCYNPENDKKTMENGKWTSV